MPIDVTKLPGLDSEDSIADLQAHPGDPDVWANAMMDSLSLRHEADIEEVRAWCAAMLSIGRTEG